MRSLILSIAIAMVAMAMAKIAMAYPGEGKSPELEELALEGTVSSQQVEKKGKDGEVRQVTVYHLETEDGKVQLPEPKVKKDETPPFKLADFVGGKVTIAAKGYKRTDKNGQQRTYVKQITSIQRVEA